MSATRNRYKRKNPMVPRTTPQPAASTNTPAQAGETEQYLETLARVADARDRGTDIIDTARDNAAALQAEAETAAA
ncbi:hypothetical protein ACWC4A_54245, partial [Streptomyces mirabilis]